MKENEKSHQNSFRVEPKRPFDATKTGVHLKNILEMNLREIEYSDQSAREACAAIVEEIKAGVKGEHFDRCRIVVTVAIGEKKMQGVQTSHSFLWDEKRDGYANHLYETSNFYARATVYGVYQD